MEFKEQIDNLSAEIYSLDKALVEALQKNVAYGKEIYKFNKAVGDLNNQIQELLKNNIDLENEKIKFLAEIEELKKLSSSLKYEEELSIEE